MEEVRRSRLLLGVGGLAVVVGLLVWHLFGAQEKLPSGDEAAVTNDPWKAREARIRRHELLLEEHRRKEAWGELVEEARALLRLDPFHEDGRALLGAAERAVVGDGERPAEGGGPVRTSGYQRARQEARSHALEAIEGLYPEPKIASAIQRYALDGRLEEAIDRLRKLARSGGQEEAAALVAALNQLGSALKDAHTALSEKRFEDAGEFLQVVVEVEGGLLPEGRSSILARELRTELAKAWFEEGKLQRARGLPELAVTSWRRGREADPSLLELGIALQRLEGELAAKGKK